MLAASRPYVLAAAALAAVSTVVVTPVVARQVPLAVRQMETKLVDAVGIDNIPINLFDDILNIPSNELSGINEFGNSLIFSGDWWVPSATNIWGTDPGDLGHYMGLVDMGIPIASISGLDQPEIDPTAAANGTLGLAQQLGLLAAAELPVSASCDAQTCYPMVPTPVITGNTGIDRDIGFLQALEGKATTADGQPFTLFSDFDKVPIKDLLDGYLFNNSDPGIVDPSPNATPDGSVLSGFGFDGTTGTGDTAGLMPWDGVTFKLNLLGPFEDFWNSLLASPGSDGLANATPEIPTLTEVTQSFQNLAAGMVIAFDPYVEGSPACAALCQLPEWETELSIVKDIEAIDPNNTSLQSWINEYPFNNANLEETQLSVAMLQTGSENLTASNLAAYDSLLASINPELPYLFTNEGYITDPGYLAYVADPTGTLDPTYGGDNASLVLGDLYTLFTNNEWNLTPLSNPDTLWYFFDPTYGNSVAESGASSASATAAVAAAAAPTLSADLSALLASLGATAGSDTLGQLFAEMTSQLSADFASFIPQSLVGLF